MARAHTAHGTRARSNRGSRSVSGLYVAPRLETSSEERAPDELRLDVDGLYAQMVASGTINRADGKSLHWMARLTPRGSDVWSGSIVYKEGPRRIFRATRVRIASLPETESSERDLQATFSGRHVRPRTQTFRFASRFFRKIDFEFDHTSDVAPTCDVKTGAHPNRPRRLKKELLTIGQVFERAGFQVTQSPNGLVPISVAGRDSCWSIHELNDAMEEFRLQRSQDPQWRLWVFTTGSYQGDEDTDARDVGGVMFDFKGRLQRQGAAIFNKSFISQAPGRDRHPDAWVQRMRFWTTCHEMGHGFNLAHSWEKRRGNPWLPQKNDGQARSFMNYPHYVRGGQRAFFRSFDYRFTDREVLFLRHAPAAFVEMGHADWLEGHAFERGPLRPSPFRLELRVNREPRTFEFLEPIMLELKLENVSNRPQQVDQSLLRSMESLSVSIRREGRPTRRFLPFAHYRYAPRLIRLQPGKAVYAAMFASCGSEGWLLAEPGRYSVRALLQLPGGDLVSNELRLRIQPGSAQETRLAQDFFSTDVGRVLAFDGSHVLKTANATLTRVAEQLPQRGVAIHAQVALACARATPSKRLQFDNGGTRIVVEPEDESAYEELRAALIGRSRLAIETLGHIDYKLYVDWVTKLLSTREKPALAHQFQQTLFDTMSTRRVGGRPIRKSVLDSIERGLRS